MRLLYVEACPRGVGVSRTYALGEEFLAAFARENPGAEVCIHRLPGMGLRAVDGEALAAREALIDARAWADGVFAPARDFAAADAIVVVAPYWDLMFPAMLKVYIEHIFVRELTFCYREDRPVGLCRAGRALFLTTAGSPVGDNDFGADYLRATFAMLGIGQMETISAEGLDVRGADVPALMAAATERVIMAAKDFCR